MPPHALRLYRADPAALCTGMAGGVLSWPEAGAGSVVLPDDLEPGANAVVKGHALWVRTDGGISSGARIIVEGGWRLCPLDGSAGIALTRLTVATGAAAGIYAIAERPPRVLGRYRLFRACESAPQSGTAERPAKTARPPADPPRFAPGKMLPASVCFVAGTRIATARGNLPVERLLPGTRVVTRDNGLQPVRWLSSQSVVDAPIQLTGQAWASTARPLIVSPEHRLLLSGPDVRTRFGQSEVLAPARCLLGRPGISPQKDRALVYVHFALDRHEIVYAEGQPAESFRPSSRTLVTLQGAAREALFGQLPALRSDPGGYGPPARLCVTAGDLRAAA